MIFKIDSTSRDAVNAFITRQWFTLDMVVHGESIDLSMGYICIIMFNEYT